MKKVSISLFLAVSIMALNVVGSCTENLNVQPDYEFTVSTMPVPKRLKKGETAEIRCEIVRAGIYDKAKYYVRYFQPEGKGNLKFDGWNLSPNDPYLINKPEAFRIYYTSQCEDMQIIDLTFYDNFNNKYDLQLSFANETVTTE
jgi:hypothetical protein